jgi:anti-anti-sigma factor
MLTAPAVGELFHYVRTEFDGQAVTRLRGELDLAGHDRLRVVLGEIAEAGRDLVVLDLADLEFMDVRSVRICCEAAVALRARGGALVVQNVSPVVRRVFEIAGDPDAVMIP